MLGTRGLKGEVKKGIPCWLSWIVVALTMHDNSAGEPCIPFLDPESDVCAAIKDARGYLYFVIHNGIHTRCACAVPVSSIVDGRSVSTLHAF